MVTKTRHTGIVVEDLEQAIGFYRGLGMKEVARKTETGTYIDQLVGLTHTKLEWAKLSLPDMSLVELLQYHSHPGQREGDVLQAANRLGCSHIAFSVDNIESTVTYILSNGGSIKNPIQISPDGNVKVIYCYDPEGNILEIVQELVK